MDGPPPRLRTLTLSLPAPFSVFHFSNLRIAGLSGRAV